MSNSELVMNQAKSAIENSISEVLERFQNDKLGTVRIVMRNNDPWFVAKDVAACIEYDPSSINKMCSLCRDKDKFVASASDFNSDVLSESRNSRITLISESGLYRILAKCNLPKCEPFESWVFDEVLPSIRKTGKYSPLLPNFSDPAEAAIAWAKEYREKQNAIAALEAEKQHVSEIQAGFEIVESRIQKEVFKQNAKAFSDLGIERKKTKRLESENVTLKTENEELKANLTEKTDQADFLKKKNEEQDQYIPTRYKTRYWIENFGHEPSPFDLAKYSRACDKEPIRKPLPSKIHGSIEVNFYHVRAWRLYEQFEWAHVSIKRPSLPF